MGDGTTSSRRWEPDRWLSRRERMQFYKDRIMRIGADMTALELDMQRLKREMDKCSEKLREAQNEPRP